MRKSLLLFVLLGEALRFTPAGADEPPDDSPPRGLKWAVAEVAESDADQPDIELTSGTADRSGDWRPGLLGHRYIEARYNHIDLSDDPFVEILDDTLQGFDATLNVPIPIVLEQSGFLGVDAFVAHRYLRLSGSETFLPPPDTFRARIEADLNNTLLATSVYVDHDRLGPVRPFVQVGMQFGTYRVRGEIDGEVTKEKDNDTFLLLAPGAEVDLWDVAALRATFELDSEEIDTSLFYGDVILWPWERVYLRGTLVVPFEGGGTGGLVGAGLAF